MNTRCERRGQLEIGIIDHEGHVYAAFGSSSQRSQRNGLHPATVMGASP